MNKITQSDQEIMIHFSISSESSKEIRFVSDEETAQAVRHALLASSFSWRDMTRDYKNYPTVITKIKINGTENVDQFLRIKGVRNAFLNAIV